YQFTGREHDGTGLLYYRARYYSPVIQRFISEDPVGFAGGDPNLYAYVANSPTNKTDSLGLYAWSGGFHVGNPGPGFTFEIGQDNSASSWTEGWFGEFSVDYGAGGGLFFNPDEGPSMDPGFSMEVFAEAKGAVGVGPLGFNYRGKASMEAGGHFPWSRLEPPTKIANPYHYSGNGRNFTRGSGVRISAGIGGRVSFNQGSNGGEPGGSGPGSSDPGSSGPGGNGNSGEVGRGK
ncbi:MAG: RHS repeat-associated core domain-containing protein, partial [Nitrospira sp.]|nr:RHS repeat-associated core domain-containing protein [Nitrospira sp.]